MSNGDQTAEPDPELVQLIEVRLSGAYPFTQLDRLIQQLTTLLEAEWPIQLTLDAGGLVFMGPTTLALLVAAVRRVEEAGLLREGSVIIPPRSPLTRQYLLRMDLFNVLEVRGLPEPFERREAVGFRPVTQFVGDDAHVASRELTAAVSEKCRVERPARNAIHICLDELAENVGFHAETELGGFAAAQGWNKRPEMEVGIVDLGRGIRESLTTNPDYADIPDDVTAIETALQPMVTATPGRNRGLGLALTRFVLADNGGLLTVRSGRGTVYSGRAEGTHESDVSFSGTIVSLTARTDQPLDLDSAYEHIFAAGYQPEDPEDAP